jgi:RND superfamily putative drug exporter
VEDRRGNRIARVYAWIVVALRPLVVLAWIAAAAAAVAFLPGLGSSSTAPIGDIVPAQARALVAEQRALRLFGATVATDTVVVERNPHGLTRRETQGAVALAADVARHRAPPDLGGVRAAVPLVDVPVPGVRWHERGTTALSYLFLAPDLNLLDRERVAQAYLSHLPRPAPGTTRGITGAGPARLAQFRAIDAVLPWVEVATVLVILAIVALSFRSILAPLVTLATAAIAYLCAVRALAWAGERLGARAPSEIEPVLVVLLLGLVTDYSVFFLSEARRRLAAGEDRVTAARGAAARIAPIVLVAGLLVTAGAASLLAGRMTFFHVFGPGLALAAAIVTLVCVTLVPAVVALLGPRLFGRGARRPPPVPGTPRRVLARVLTAPAVALVIVAVCVGGLAVAAAGVRKADLGVSFISSLPPHDGVRRAADDAARGFGPGVLSPADVVLEQPGVGGRPAQLVALQRLIARRPGVTGVLGPTQGLPAPVGRFVVARGGGAVRFVVLLAHEPTGAAAIRTIKALQRDLPALTRRAGLPPGARLSYGGDTALAAETVDVLIGDLWRVGVATACIMFLLLALFLRALLAPLLLLVGGALAFAGAFGLTSLLLPHTVGGSEFVYYVPLVAAVLLVGLGSDYNVFIVGRIREEAQRRPLREAIAVAVPQASRAVTIAGITLASTFALLALVPLLPFRELAMLMTIGVLIDALFVRPVLVPAMIAAVGRRAWWPSRSGDVPAGAPEPRFSRPAAPEDAPEAAPSLARAPAPQRGGVPAPPEAATRRVRRR